MMGRARVVLLAAAIAIVLVLSAATYLWLSGLRPGEGPPPLDVPMTIEAFRTGLEYPIALAFSPDGRVWYAERRTGNIQILETATANPKTFYTLTGTNSAGERGLLGLALDPDFPTSPFVYAYQTYNDPADGTIYNRLVRIEANGDVGVGHTVLLRLPPPNGPTNHNGGVIAFGPDGKLYAVVGEQANTAHSQDPMSPLGKVLRLNPDGSAPTDNPFFNNQDWHPLVYTYGHRNMFGLTFHPTTDRAYVTENGQNDNDEINRLVPGGNYGWPVVRGVANNPSYVDPIRAYLGIIVPTNAAFYTGSVPAALQNHLVFGTYQTPNNDLRDLALDSDGSRVLNEAVLATAPDEIIDVEMGRDGYLWLTTPTGIYRLVPVDTGRTYAPAFVVGTAVAAVPALLGRSVASPDAAISRESSCPPSRKP